MKKHIEALASLSLAMLAVLFLVIVVPTRAQEVATQATAAVAEPVDVTVTSSEAATPVSGSATASRTGTSGTETEAVAFSGNVAINASVVTDPALPTGVSLFVDCKGLRGAGQDSGTPYLTSCEANVTRLFRPKDQITVTFAFFEDKTDSFLDAKTGQVTITLTYDEATKQLTGATAVVGTFDATADGTVDGPPTTGTL